MLKGYSPSVMEKLIWSSSVDDEKRTLSQPTLSLAEVKRSVARDLEHLLNTRRGYRDAHLVKHHGLINTLLSYGLEDISSSSMANADDRNNLCRVLERTITTHEPRLKQVRASIHYHGNGLNKLSFTIHAHLVLNKQSEPVNFDAEFNAAKLHYVIRNG